MNKISDPVDVLQSCREDSKNLNNFSRQLLIDRINKMNDEELNSFCKSILHLREFYDWNSNCWVTDKESAIEGRESLFSKAGPINFDAPIRFEVFNKEADTNNFSEG